MKLYNSVGPNPHVVRMFMAEKNISIPKVEVDIMKNENRGPAHVARNPMGQLPALELDNGTFLSEITAICEYLEEKYPKPALVGTTAEERAETRMWARRIDLNIIEPLAGGFRYAEGLPIFKDRIRTIPEAAAPLKTIAKENLAKIDGLLGSKQYLCGDRFTLADILLYCFLAFGAMVGQPLDPANKNLSAWMARVAARPTAKA